MSPGVPGGFCFELIFAYRGYVFSCSIQFYGTIPVRFEVVALSGIEKRLNSLAKRHRGVVL